MAQSPGSRIILVGLLSRGDRHVEAPALAFLQPSRHGPALFSLGSRVRVRIRVRVRVLSSGFRL